MLQPVFLCVRIVQTFMFAPGAVKPTAVSECKAMAVNTPNEFMNNSYDDLVKQTFNYPQEDFETIDGNLHFNGLDLKALIDKYGTPMKLTYLPKIGMQIKKAKKMFATAIAKHKYEGKYNYCYCTKSSHFSFIVEEALNHDIHLETSYAYDIEIVKKLYARKKITK